MMGVGGKGLWGQRGAAAEFTDVSEGCKGGKATEEAQQGKDRNLFLFMRPIQRGSPLSRPAFVQPPGQVKGEWAGGLCDKFLKSAA